MNLSPGSPVWIAAAVAVGETLRQAFLKWINPPIYRSLARLSTWADRRRERAKGRHRAKSLVKRL